MLCRRLIDQPTGDDWAHIVNENHRLDYYYHLEYLMRRVGDRSRRNILGLYRNPERHLDTAPDPRGFEFMGYDLIEEATQISALTNCGGFSESFSNDELNECGLISSFARARAIRDLLAANNPREHHADCEMYAVWRLAESGLS